MERRAFLATATMALMIGVAEAKPITESPLFNVDGSRAYVFETLPRSFDDSGLPNISFRILRHKFEDNQGFEMHSVEDIENHLLASAYDLKIDQLDREGAASHHFEHLTDFRRNVLSLAIVSECNQVAIQSRRGPANHVLMHPILVERLYERVIIPLKRVTPYTVGRWTVVGTLAGAQVLTSETAPRREVTVFWRNTVNRLVDGPATVMQVDGRYRVIPISKYPVMSRFRV